MNSDSRGRAPNRRARAASYPWLGLAALIAVAAAVLSPVFANGFVYDDYAVIIEGQTIHDLGEIPALFANSTMYISPRHRGQELAVNTYRPIAALTLFWDAALSGRQPWAYHLTNLIAHLITVVLLFVFIRRLLGRERWPFALAATAWFALTPLPQASHIWINGRSDVLAAVFGLSCLLAWRAALEQRERRRRLLLHGLALVCFALGLLSKEVLLLTLPALVLWPETEPTPLPVRLRHTAGFLSVGTLYLVVRVSVLGGVRAGADLEQMAQAIRAFPILQWDAFVQSLAPTNVHLRFLNYDYANISPAVVAVLALGWVSAAVGAFRVRRRAPLISWGLLWFACVLAPVSVIPTMLWPGFGRYLYVPAIGLSVALADLGARAYEAHSRIRRVLLGAAGLYLTALALVLSGFVMEYRSGETLYGAAFEADPENGHALGWLGLHYMERSQYSEAIGPLARAHQLAPTERRYLAQLGDAFIHTNQRQAAQRLALEGIAQFPDDPGYFHVLLVNLTNESHPHIATEHILLCLRDAPGDQDCGALLTSLVTRHPLREQYRRLVRMRLAEPDMEAVRERTAPLMNSLP